MTHRPAGHALLDPSALPLDLVSPRGGLEAEGDGGSGLPVRASRHHGFAVVKRQGDARGLALPQVRQRQFPDIAHDHAEPRVREVLDGDSEVHMLARCLGKRLLQNPNETEGGMRCLPRALGHRLKVQFIHVQCRDGPSRFGGNEAHGRLLVCEHAQDVQPGGHSGGLGEDRLGLRRGPAMPVHRGLRQTADHWGSRSCAMMLSASRT